QYSYEREGKTQRVVILQLHRRIQFLPPPRITIKASLKDQIEAILARQLGEWPANESQRVVGAGQPIAYSKSASLLFNWKFRLALVAVLMSAFVLWANWSLSRRMAAARQRPNTAVQQQNAVTPQQIGPLSQRDPEVYTTEEAVVRFHELFSQSRYGELCAASA